MSQVKVEIVREALQRLLLAGELTDTADDFVLRDHALDKTYEGEEGLSDWLGDWSRTLGDAIVEPSDYIDADDRVVVVLDLSGRAPAAMLFELRGGDIVSLDYYGSAEEALAAARV